MFMWGRLYKKNTLMHNTQLQWNQHENGKNSVLIFLIGIS